MAKASGRVEAHFVVSGKDEFSAVIQKNMANLKRWERTVKQSEQSASVLSSAVERLEGGWQELNSKVELAQAIFQAMGSAADEMVTAEKAEATAELFRQLTEDMTKRALTASDAMGALRIASGRLVDDTKIQQFANKMMITGQGLEDLVVALNAATGMTQATGEDLIATATQIAKAMNTGEVETLKNIGIQKNMTLEQQKYAATLNKTANLLTVAEKKTIVMEVVTKGLKDQFAAAGLDLDRLDTSLQKAAARIENKKSAAAAAALATHSWTDSIYDSIFGQHKLEERLKSGTEEVVKRIKSVNRITRGHGKLASVTDSATTALKEHNRSLQLSQEEIEQLAPLLAEAAHLEELTTEKMEEWIAASRIKGLELSRLFKKEAALLRQSAEKREEADRTSEIQRRITQTSRDQIEIQKANLQGNKRAAIQAQFNLDINKAWIRSLEYKITLDQKEAEIELASIKRQAALAGLAKQRREKWLAFQRRFEAAQLSRVDRIQEINEAVEDLDHEHKVKMMDKNDEFLALLFRHEREKRDLRRKFAADLEKGDPTHDFRDRQQKALTQLETAHTKERNELVTRLEVEEFAKRSKAEKENMEARIRIVSIFGTHYTSAYVDNTVTPITNAIQETDRVFAGSMRGFSDLMMEMQPSMKHGADAMTNAVSGVGEIARAVHAAQGDMLKAAGPSLSAMGRISAGFTKNKKEEAAILSAFEFASALAATAAGNIPGAIAHAAAGSMFAALAGKGSAKKQSAAGRQGSFGAGGAAGPQNVSMGPSNVVLNVNGFVSADENQIAKGMTDVLSGIDGGGFVGGTI